jgi:maltose-binding protein MalE
MKRVTKGALVMAAVSVLSLSATMAQDRTSATRPSANTTSRQRAATLGPTTSTSRQEGYQITPDGLNGWTTRRSINGFNKNQQPLRQSTLRAWFEQ